MNASPVFDLHDDEIPAAAAGVVDQGLGDANATAAALHEVRALACFAHDGDGTTLGGAVGRTWGACCELQQLWVAPAQRRSGLGTQLVRRFEAAAAARGCVLVILETFSFQAPGFYRGLGYVQVHQIAQFPHGIEKFWFERVLAAPN